MTSGHLIDYRLRESAGLAEAGSMIEKETAHAWAEIHKSSAKDGQIGWKYGYSDPTGDVEVVAARLAALGEKVKSHAHHMPAVACGSLECPCFIGGLDEGGG